MNKGTKGPGAFFTKYREILLYMLFGCATTAASWGGYWFFMLILPFENQVSISLLGKEFVFTLNIVVANSLSWVLAVAVAFVTNKQWVFESRSWERKLVLSEAATFVGGRAVTGVFEIVALPVLIGMGMDGVLFGVEGFAAKMLISVIVIILNYICSKFISFRSVRKKPEA